MKVTNIEDIYELSPLQQGMLFHTLYAPKSGLYFQQHRFSFQGGCNISALKRAWQKAVNRHPVLRTSFYLEDLDKPLQVVHQRVKLPFELHDWRKVPPPEQEARLEAYLKEERKSGFVLSLAPLIRLTLIRIADDTYELIWSHHHMLLDGWSGYLVAKEVADCYVAYCRGQDLHLEPVRPYGDYIAWLQEQDLAEAKAFWRRSLKGFTNPTPLVVDRVARPDKDEYYDEQHVWLARATTDAMRSFVSHHKLTLNTLVQGAWALLLSNYSNEEDIVFGVTMSGRPATMIGCESMVGLFINTLPVRVSAVPQASLLAWLKALQDQQAEMRQYEYSSLVQVQGWSDVPRGRSLFESILVFENHPGSANVPEQKDTQTIIHAHAADRTGYPLTVLAVPGPELGLRIIYDTSRFDTAIISRMLCHLQTLLQGLVSNPEQRLGLVPLLTEAERRQLLFTWNHSKTDYPEPTAIHHLFEAQVMRTPETLAVVSGEKQLNYRELNRRSNQLAHRLRSKRVGPDVLVGICLDRSIEMVIALLGVLKAGGAYLPLDPSYPQERLGFMVEDALATVVLTRQELVEGLAEMRAEIICLDSDWTVIAQENEENPVSGVVADNMVYAIYTSGSTGRPKGVVMTHSSLSNLLSWQSHCGTLSDEIRTLQFSSLSFDVSFQEMFSTWCSGGTLVMISDEVRRDAVSLLYFIAENSVERLFLPYTALQQLAVVADDWQSVPTCLGEIITAGEPLQIVQPIAKLFSKLEGCTLHNQYGPTESHVVTSFTLVGPFSDWPALPPIGRPIDNTQIYLLDPQLRPVPIGVPGELHIGGIGLARCYLKRPGLTAEKFIPHPFSDKPGARLYKTGDFARYLPDGNIEFLGRIDDQVKIRGFRIEPGEVEVVLCQHPAIQVGVVLAREDVPGNLRLVAYVVPYQEPVPLVGELRGFLKQTLPDYMLPSIIVFLEALPLTPSGKVDRRALPAPDTARPAVEEAYVAPDTPAEKILAEIWAEMLNLEQIGIHDNFFELGGHSLLATQLVSRIRNTFNVEMPLRNIFEMPTVAGLARNIEFNQWSTQDMPPSFGSETKDYEEGEL